MFNSSTPSLTSLAAMQLHGTTGCRAETLSAKSRASINHHAMPTPQCSWPSRTGPGHVAAAPQKERKEAATPTKDMD